MRLLTGTGTLQINNIFNPARGIRDVQRRAGHTPVDHARNNKRAVAQQSEANAMRKLVRACLAAGWHCTLQLIMQVCTS